MLGLCRTLCAGVLISLAMQGFAADGEPDALAELGTETQAAIRILDRDKAEDDALRSARLDELVQMRTQERNLRRYLEMVEIIAERLPTICSRRHRHALMGAPFKADAFTDTYLTLTGYHSYRYDGNHLVSQTQGPLPSLPDANPAHAPVGEKLDPAVAALTEEDWKTLWEEQAARTEQAKRVREAIACWYEQLPLDRLAALRKVKSLAAWGPDPCHTMLDRIPRESTLESVHGLVGSGRFDAERQRECFYLLEGIFTIQYRDGKVAEKYFSQYGSRPW